MPIINCDTPADLQEIIQNLLCDRGGFWAAFWAKAADVNFESSGYDAETNVLSSWAMNGGGTFKRLYMDRETSQYVSTYNEEQGLYDSVITMNFKGKTKEQTQAISTGVNTCSLVLHVFNNDCTERIFGVEFDGEGLNVSINPLKIRTHVDQGGNLTGERSADNVTLGAKHGCAAIHGTVGIDAMPAS